MNLGRAIHARGHIIWLRIRLAAHDLWRPPCESCSENPNPATICVSCARKASPNFINASGARYCHDCEIVFSPANATCPACGSHQWTLLVAILGGELPRRKVQRPAPPPRVRRPVGWGDLR